MNKVNEELTNELIQDRMEQILEGDLDPEEEERLFKQAMTAIDKQNECDKTLLNSGLKVLEIAGLVLVVPAMDYFAKDRFMKKLCTWERDQTFTTTPGRSISSFFRWNK